MRLEPWLIYALLSALCAALVAILAKIGMKDIDSTLATFVRSLVMTFSLASLCFIGGLMSKLGSLHRSALIMIVLSGVAGAASWLFYFRAIQVGSVAQAAPIDKLSVPIAVILAVLILRERPSALNWVGIALICLGAVFTAIPRTNQ